MTCDKNENVAWDANPAAGTRKTLEIAGVEFPFRYCPPGTFTMGSPASEAGFLAFWETPHKVTLTRGFWTLETPVTQGMYKAVDGSNPSAFKFGKRFPVENVSWWHCQAFLEALERLNVAPTGFAFRLPWEAEWEYACRAGTSTAYYWGDAWDDDRANCGGCQNRDAAPSAVGRYDANPWGLFDMSGNVAEWVADWEGEYDAAPQIDPTGPESGKYRVTRGGEWMGLVEDCRSGARSACGAEARSMSIGFRIVLARKV
ncbi:MAG: formylglycine-generating enzyme family protein [Thermoguttaceae bacterium]|nr:formylglycine-generating enzyme family protein [Thermoguttaceae bacterium]